MAHTVEELTAGDFAKGWRQARLLSFVLLFLLVSGIVANGFIKLIEPSLGYYLSCASVLIFAGLASAIIASLATCNVLQGAAILMAKAGGKEGQSRFEDSEPSFLNEKAALIVPDDGDRLWCLQRDKKRVIVHSLLLSDISDASVKRHYEKIESSKRNVDATGAAVGGLLYGPVGAVLGSVFAGQKETVSDVHFSRLGMVIETCDGEGIYLDLGADPTRDDHDICRKKVSALKNLVKAANSAS